MSTVLITGANSGFGKAAALAFARRGHQVFGTARNEVKARSLQAAAQRENLQLHTPLLDVTRPASFPALIAGIIEAAGRIDILINNAGVWRPGALEDLPEAEIRLVMETNFFAPLLLSRTALPYMRRQGSGQLIMISSLSGIAGLAGAVTYSASKFALEGATEALRHEVDQWGIHVALVEAAQYNTGLFGDSSAPPDYCPETSPYRALTESGLSAIQRSRPPVPSTRENNRDDAHRR